MKNVWKGFVIGGLTGAGAGGLLDLLSAGSHRASVVGSRVAAAGSEAADRAAVAMAEGAHRLHEVDVPDHLGDVTRWVGNSDLVEQVKHVASRTVERGKELVDARHVG